MIETLPSLLPRLGWRIDHTERLARPVTWWAEEQNYGSRLSLATTSPPLGRRVRLDVYETHWGDEGEVIIRPAQPLWFGEVALSEAQAERDNWRQLRRVLRWFHDPSPSELWASPRKGDWFPPTAWLSDAGVKPLGLDLRWPTCHDPDEMLRYLGTDPTERKLRLLACALARQMPVTMLPVTNRHIVAFAEQHAEGLCPRRELKKAAQGTALRWLLAPDPAEVVAAALAALRREAPAWANRAAADLIREVLGNPFAPVVLRQSWLRAHGGAARDLASAIAASADFAAMPVLADALEDAGCADAIVLDHARAGGPHVRGCWLIDRLRGL